MAGLANTFTARTEEVINNDEGTTAGTGIYVSQVFPSGIAYITVGRYNEFSQVYLTSRKSMEM